MEAVTMRPSTVWRKEVLELTRRRKALAVKLAFPLVLGSPLLLASPPPAVVAGAVTLLAVVIGVFGVGVRIARDRTDGVLPRLAILPLSPGRVFLERWAVAAGLEMAQLVPVLLVLLLRYRPEPWLAALCLLALLVTVLVANALGVLVAATVSSPAEMHLYAALAMFPLLALAGVFMPLVPGDGWRVAVAGALPFAHLNRLLMEVLGEAALWPAGFTVAVSTVWMMGAPLMVWGVAARACFSEE